MSDVKVLEAAISTMGKEVTNIKLAMREQNRILTKLVYHQGRLIDLMEKIAKETKCLKP